MSNVNVKIDDEDFRLLKENIPKCTSILKPRQKDIIAVYVNVHHALRDLKIGPIDDHHPKIIAAYKAHISREGRAIKSKMNTYMSHAAAVLSKSSDMIAGIDNRYLGNPRHF